jgi:outer membrane protein
MEMTERRIGLMRRSAVTLCAVIMMGMCLASVAEAELKIGVVDLQKAMELSEAGQKAKAAFQKKVDKVQQDLKTKQDELSKLKDELDRQSVLLSEEARVEKQSSYQLGLKDFKRLYEDAQEELRREDAKLSEKIIKDLQEVIDEYGEKEKYDLILEKTQSGLIHRNPQLDITNKIILMYDESKKGK